jgi:hypothetical protein
MSGALKIWQLNATAVFAEHFCRQKSVIHQLCLNSGRRNLEMIRGFLNHVSREISGHELLESLNRAEKFGCKRPLCSLTRRLGVADRQPSVALAGNPSSRRENERAQIGAQVYFAFER